MTTPSDFHRTSTGQSTGGSARRQAGEKATDLKDSAKHLAEDVQDRATEAVETNLSRQKNRAARTLHGIAQSLRQSGQNLQEQDAGDAQDYVDGAARQLDKLADFLQRTDLQDAGANLEDFARRQPALFIGGAFALGLLGARFLKSSQRGDRSTALTEYQGGYAGSSGYGTQAGYGTRTGYGTQAGYGTQSGARPVGERDVSGGLGGNNLADMSPTRSTGGTGSAGSTGTGSAGRTGQGDTR